MVHVIMYFIVSMTQMLVFSVYLRELLEFRHPVYWMPVLWAIGEVVNQAASRSLGSSGNAIVYLAELEIMAFVMCYGNALRKLFLVLAFDGMCIILEVLCINILAVSTICDMESILGNPLIADMILLLTQFLLFLLIEAILFLWKNDVSAKAVKGQWIGVFGVCGSCFMATIAISADVLRTNSVTVTQTIMLAVLIELNFASYYFYVVSIEKNRVDMEAKIYHEQINMYREWYEGFRLNRQRVQAFRHDMRNHMGVIGNLCKAWENGKKPEECLYEIRKYVENINTECLQWLYETDSGNLMLDAIMNTKKSYASSKGIVMYVEQYVPEKMKYDSMDLVILLGNILDNAIEACEKTMPDQTPEIKISIKYQSSNLIIETRNTYDGHLDERSSEQGVLIKTDKQGEKGHGFGMKNILRIVEKYNGVLEWKAEAGVFMESILLYGIDRPEIGRK